LKFYKLPLPNLETAKEFPRHPNHLKDRSLYTKGRLEDSIRYVDEASKKGEPTPLCVQALNLYRSAFTKVLELEQATDFVDVAEAKAAWIQRIYDCERNMMVYQALTPPLDKERRALQNSIVDLHRAAFYTRYSKFFIEGPLKDATEGRKRDVCERLEKEYWVDIEKTTQEEKPAYDRKVMRPMPSAPSP
jgi:hypothetical protein